MIRFVDLAAQHSKLKSELDRAISDVISSSGFILSAAVDQFEQEFARFVGVSHAIGVSNGGDALRLALLALDIGPGDEVIVPANSYIAAALAVSAVGARPVLVDCDPTTYSIDPARVERAVTSRVRAVMPVHLGGQAADMDPILELASRFGLVVVEDAAQAHGARYRDRACGSMGIAGCFSFYPSKNLGALGDGGAVVTSEPRVVERVRRLRNYGQDVKYQHVEKGWNARLDAIQAKVLSVKLPHLEEWNEARRRHAASYRELLMGVGDLVLRREPDDRIDVYHLFMVETDARDALQRYLREHGIETVIHYPVPIHLQPAYAELGHGPDSFPHTERLARRTVSLPMYPELTEEEIREVSSTIREFFDRRV